MDNCSSVVVSRNSKSRVTRALGDRLQFMIRDIAIDELFTVATSLVAAKRNVVLYKLISMTYSKHEVSAIKELATKIKTHLRRTKNSRRRNS
jgi:hypothetical protein